MLRGAARDLVRSWPNVSEVTVKGTHFIHEGSDEEIGPTITNWRASYAAYPHSNFRNKYENPNY